MLRKTSPSHYSVFWFCLWCFLACTVIVKYLNLSWMTSVFSIIVRRDLPTVLRIKTKKNFPMFFFSSSFLVTSHFNGWSFQTVPWQSPTVDKSKFLFKKKKKINGKIKSDSWCSPKIGGIGLKCWNQLLYHKIYCWPWCNLSLASVTAIGTGVITDQETVS